MRARVLALNALLLSLSGCPRKAALDDAGVSEVFLPDAPRWPKPVAAAAVAPGFEEVTVHHETVHVSVVVPRGTRLDRTRDAHGYPLVLVHLGAHVLSVQFDSGQSQLGKTLARKPPRVYSMVATKAQVKDDNLAALYRDSSGTPRVLGVVPGAKCSFEAFRPPADHELERVFDVCASLRSAPPGRWREATAAERAHGGMTAVPSGAWVEGALPSTPGSLLRPGKFVARLHAGGLVVSSQLCPARFEELAERSTPEVSVELLRLSSARGEAWVRLVTEEYDGDRFPGPTQLWAPRDGRCCSVTFLPWTSFPSRPELEYALALCDTYRAR